MGRPASGTRDATTGLSGRKSTEKGKKLVGGRSNCDHRGGDCCGHAAVTSGWRDMRGGYTEEREAQTATATLWGGRLSFPTSRAVAYQRASRGSRRGSRGFASLTFNARPPRDLP
jgi:hypothetical protein